MKYLKRWCLVLALFAMPAAAFDFNNSTANYDFTQTVEILIVDQKNSKFFAMFDPFEMKVTTAPSRFYVAVMGVLQRGHANADGVAQVQGAIVDYEYVLIFRSLNSSHVMFIGKNWVIDGNKKILLTAEEISAIYEVLLWRSNNDQRRDMDILELLFKEINEQQEAGDVYPKIESEDELKSIIESKKSIQERLPESHDDTKTLPYYNKALENQKFLEEYEQAKKSTEKLSVAVTEHTNTPNSIDKAIKEKTVSPATADAPLIPSENQAVEESSVREQENTSTKRIFVMVAFAGLALIFLYFIFRQRHAR